MYKKQAVTCEYINATLSTISVFSGSAAAASVLPVITVPIAVPLGSISAVAGVASAITLAVSRNRRIKLARLTKHLIDEKSVYNAIIVYVSKALNDSYISDEEFTHINKMYDEMSMAAAGGATATAGGATAGGATDQQLQLAQEIAGILNREIKK
jgi:hypothetical protein